MPNNITAPAAGAIFATLEIGGVHYPLNLIADQNGADILGALTASPSANSISGRLKAIADALASGAFYLATQPISAAALPLPTGAATEATAGLINGKLPSSLGPKTGALSFSVTPASDVSFGVTGTFWQATQPVSGTVAVTGVATEATLGLVNAKFPASLGAKLGAASLSVVPATDAVFGVTGTFWQATQPVSGTVAVTGVATEATLLLQSAKLPASLGIKTAAASLSIAPASDATFAIGFVSGGHMSAQTNATGSNWTAFASQALKQLTIVNDTGTKIDTRQDAAGVAIPIADGNSFTFFGISNANQIGIRRNDTSNTQVTAVARWEA